MTGLVGWWPLYENSGSANDLSGNENHGTVNGPTQGVWGRGGMTAYAFDGNDGVNIGSNLFSYTEHTLAAWVKFDSISGSSKDTILNNDGRNAIQLLNGDFNYYIFDGDGNNATGPAASTDVWYHVVGTFDGSTMRLYVDGQEEASIGSGAPDFSIDSQTRIGTSDDQSNYLDGNICDVRMYNRALSAAEVQTLYDWGSGDYTRQSLHNGSDSGAVSRYEFENDVTDSWGSNDGADNTSAGYTSDAIVGSAKSFDGTNDYINMQASVHPDDSTQPLTLSCFVRPTRSGAQQHIMGRHDNGNNNGYEQIDIDITSSDNFRFQIYGGNNPTTKEWSVPSFSGHWYHITATYDGSKNSSGITPYINGRKANVVSEQNNSLTDTLGINANFTVGARDNNNPGDFYGGDIDEVRVFNRELDAHEVHQLYQWGTRGIDMRAKTVMR